MGTRLGFPTANLALEEDLLVPARGIYIVRGRLGKFPSRSKAYEGVANVGTRPSVDDGTLMVEAHLFGIENSLYDQEITVEYLRRIRDEKRFSSLTELQGAIANDVATARAYFDEGGREP